MQNTIAGLLRTTMFLVCLAVTGRSFADQPAGTRTPADQIPWPEDSSRAEGSAMRTGLQTLVIMNHFAQTGDEEVVAACTGMGPTGTTFVNAADDPRRR